jgi:hypothetical protein
MFSNFFKKVYKPLIILCLILAIGYGLSRLYYRVTGGFTIGNITYNLPYDPRWDTHPLTAEESQRLDQIFNQTFSYLGKGCQSYVFQSQDKQYVIKFFKYQRFRPQPWLSYFTFIPAVNIYFDQKIEKKRKKLETVFVSWKIAYEDLQPETGVVYVHLNKTKNIQKQLKILDKMGLEHPLNLDDFEFLIQRKAQMLCPRIDELMTEGKTSEAKLLISLLLSRIMSEYYRGYADNDHALMQNTGVLEGLPVHIDVGQFVQNDRVKNPKLYHQEIFNKTWKFRKWLAKKYPDLELYVITELKQIMGNEPFESMKPRLNKAEVGVISHRPSF